MIGASPAAPRRITAVTGSRADFGLLYWVLRTLAADTAFRVDLAVTGMHLAPEFGLTVTEVAAAGIPISAQVETLLAGDSPVAIAKAIGLGVIGFADAWSRDRPDLVLLLGDRFETFAAAQAAFILRLPIAHIGGGDLTEGVIDDAMRHSISKMAQLHFTTNEPARQRLLRMGENPEQVFTVGSPGLDQIRRIPLLDRDTLGGQIGFPLRARNLLVTFHPVTLDAVSSADQFAELLAALDSLGPEIGLIFTHPNADAEGRILISQLKAFVARHANAVEVVSLGQQRYLSALALVNAVVGNSSSGLYEAPSMATATVNIGDRQKGRLRAASVIDCPPERAAIALAVTKAINLDCRDVVNPYGGGDCAQSIHRILSDTADFQSLIRKTFFDQ